jgi:hypothetical protein
MLETSISCRTNKILIVIFHQADFFCHLPSVLRRDVIVNSPIPRTSAATLGNLAPLESGQKPTLRHHQEAFNGTPRWKMIQFETQTEDK